MEMPTKKTTVLLFAVLLLGGTAMWLAMPRNEPPVTDASATQQANVGDAVATPAIAAIPSHPTTTPAATNTQPAEPPNLPNTARERAATGEHAVLRVVLRGLHRDVPWTTPLHLEYVGLYDTNGAVHHDDAVPDAEGHAQFVLPTWWQRCRHGRITAENDRYRASAHQWMSTPDIENEVVIDVLVLAELTGRVVDARGKPADATVTAFLFAAGRNIAVATTIATADGTWRMPVPPDRDLLVVAQPTGGGDSPPRRSTKLGLRRQPTPAVAPVVSLPTSRRVTCRAGTVIEVPQFVLPEAAALRCKVVWSDGGPIQYANVKLSPRGGTSLGTHEGPTVQLREDGRLTASATRSTDANGAADLPLLAATEADVQLLSVPGAVLPPGNVEQPVTGPSIEFRLPQPVTLRATANGTVVRGVSFESPEWTGSMRIEAASCAFVPTRPLRVRATDTTRCSAWFDVVAADAGKTVDLELTERRIEVRVTLQGLSVASHELFEWTASDGRNGSDSLFAEAGQPFRLFLEPGSYRLTVGRTSWSQLATETQFVVDREPITVTLAIRRGAYIVVDAQDGSGTNVAGTCQVLDANGEDVTAEFVAHQVGDQRRGKRGELLLGTRCRMDRALPPGDYELLFDLPTVGVRRQRVNLREGEGAEIHVRP